MKIRIQIKTLKNLRNDVVDEEEQCFLRAQVDSGKAKSLGFSLIAKPLADQEVELADGQLRGHQVLLLVQVLEAGFGCLKSKKMSSLIEIESSDFSCKSEFLGFFQTFRFIFPQ